MVVPGVVVPTAQRCVNLHHLLQLVTLVGQGVAMGVRIQLNRPLALLAGQGVAMGVKIQPNRPLALLAGQGVATGVQKFVTGIVIRVVMMSVLPVVLEVVLQTVRVIAIQGVVTIVRQIVRMIALSLVKVGAIFHAQVVAKRPVQHIVVGPLA